MQDDLMEATEEVLRRKLQVYKRENDHNRTMIVEAILRQGIMAVKATTPPVNAFARRDGTGAKRKLVDLPTPEELRNRDGKRTSPMTGEQAIAVMRRMVDDPVYAAEIQLEMRRPGRHSKARHHIAGRAAIREPMLNASPDSIRNGLAYHEPSHKDRLVKGKVYADLIVKPASRAAAKSDGPSSWVERRWQVFTLKYASGYIIVTDKGSESRVFPSFGELRSAITKSGWEIVRA